MQNFTTDAWPTYLEDMARNGTFGNHLTLQAAADLFNVEFIVISSLGPSATTVISPLNSVPISSFYIGHFAEGDGERYVVLENDAIWQESCMEERAAESEVVPDSDNNATQEPSYSLFETTVTSEVAAEEGDVQEKINKVTSDRVSQASTLPPTSPVLPNWASAWISFIAAGQGWFGISSIFCKNQKKRLS